MSDRARTIVVVEDEPFLRMVATDILEDAGWSVIVCHTADDAAVICRTAGNDVEAVLTDINMPGTLDGLDLAVLIAATTYDDIIDAACGAWRSPLAQPDALISIGLRQWAIKGQR